MKKLSIVIPAYNEERFIQDLLRRIQAVPTEDLGYEKEIIVVDDGSLDRTSEFASAIHGIRCLRQIPNRGKGRAVQRGICEATGDYILVQDADLEYDPRDYRAMLQALGHREDRAIYGSRTLGQIRAHGWIRPFPGKHPQQRIGPWGAGTVLSAWTLALYRKWISDTLTAYKLYPAKAIRAMDIKTHGFETDHEITAKLIRAGIEIVEVPIAYEPRSVAEGKKIKPRDGAVAVWTLFKFRFLE